ncbi:MAG: tRNA (N6-isopentenyl adenosine(37)-C2)-methylthiotransferase MiaB [Puniceicoccales bacterium]|nr:tRNA (N6-isopentenyl adenosine(37)-C2)-methylthiotransferase MiaB [Puniceicoccales bacterium]
MGRSICVFTFGCQMNCRDSETMEAVLEESGHLIVAEKDADVAIVNSCSVREFAEEKAINRLRSLVLRKKKQKDFLVGVAGCMAQRLGGELFSLVPGLDFAIGTGNFHRVGEALGRAINGEDRVLLIDSSEPYGRQARRYGSLRPSANLSIGSGCPMRCSYCIVPQVRGSFSSRPMEDIVSEARQLAMAGTREVVLLGQIVNMYGFRQLPTICAKSPFVQLLERIHDVDGIDRIRFLSPHPCGFRDDLMSCFERLPKLCRAVHLPLQSGSNRVLRAMGRGYSIERALSIIKSLRNTMEDCSISTDLIVGFPGESDEDFQLTANLFNEIDFDMAYLFKFSPRAGTAAATLPNQIPTEVVEERHRILLGKLAETSLRRNKLFLGKTLSVLAEGKSKKDPAVLVGHSHQEKKVFFPAPAEIVGSIVKVTVISASVAALSGKI